MSSSSPPPAAPAPVPDSSWAPASSPFSWRLLDVSHQEAIDALHRRAVGPLTPSVVKPERPDFFARILAGGGRVIGVFDRDLLVAYGIIQHALPDGDDPRPELGIAPEVMRVKLAGASVAPDLRGRGLQRALIAARVRLARQIFPDRPLMLYSTSAPGNLPSWANLMAEHFAIRAVKLYYGGHPRYVMVREDGTWQRGAEMIVDPGDLDRQRQLLAKGWRGVGVRKAPDGPQVVYAAPAAPAEQP